MWLRTEDMLINLAMIASVYKADTMVNFATSGDVYYVEKNSPEAAQALFEHVAQILEAKI